MVFKRMSLAFATSFQRNQTPGAVVRWLLDSYSTGAIGLLLPVMWCCLVLIRLVFCTEQQRLSITSMVRIITTLCRSRVTSNCFPNLHV